MDYDDAVTYIADLGRTNFAAQSQKNHAQPQIGVEIEYPHGANDLRALTAPVFMRTLDNLAQRNDTRSKRDAASPVNRRIGIAFTDNAAFTNGSGVSPEVDYDFGPEAEIGTEIMPSLEAAYNQVDAIEDAASNDIDTGQLYRQGLFAGLMNDDRNDLINWDITADDTHLTVFEAPKIRYKSLDEWYTVKNLGLGGTGSIQVTSTPLFGEETETDFVRFMGGHDDVPGIPALSSIFLAPFMNSAVIEDGELRHRYGREMAYQMGRVNSPIITPDEGFSKFGYYPEFAEMDGFEDLVRINAERPYEFTMPIGAGDLEVDGLPLYERPELGHLDAETPVPVLAAAKTADGYEPTTLREIIEDQYVDGTVNLQGVDGEWYEETVRADWQDMDDQDFLEDVVPELYAEVEGSNVPNWRPKVGIGVIESRDHCNSPYERESVAMQAAVFRNWRELQNIAAAYGITDDDAEAMRIGLSRDGMSYELWDEVPVTDVLSDMQDALRDGSQDVSNPYAARDVAPVDALESYLGTRIETETTPADDMFGAYKNDAFEDAYRHRAIGPRVSATPRGGR